MSRTKNTNFDQNKYMAEWKKANMKHIGISYKTEFVNDFKAACVKLGISQSQALKAAMQDIINKAKV